MFADKKIAVQRERDWLHHFTYERLRDAMTLHFKMAARSRPCGVREKEREGASGRERAEGKKAAIADSAIFFLKNVTF